MKDCMKTTFRTSGGYASVVVMLLSLALPSWCQTKPPMIEDEVRLAGQQVEKGEYSKALEILVPLEKRKPGSFEVQHMLAIVLDICGKPEEANRHFQKALALNPKSAVAHASLGTSFARIGRVDAAVAEFKAALKIDPRNSTASYNLGTLLLQQKKPRDAVTWLQKAYSLQPAVYENGYHLALCYFVLGEYARTEKVLAGLMPVPKERAEYYLVLALNQKALGNPSQAQKTLDEILPVLVAQPDAHEQIAMLLFSRQMYKEAVPILEAAAERFPDSHIALANLALAELRTGALEKAQAHASHALAIRETPETHLILADILEAARQPMAAMEHFQRAAKMDPSERNLIALGYEFMSHWNWKEARDVFAFGLTRHDRSWRLLMGMGACYLGTEEFEKATQYLLRAIELAPEELLGYQLLAQGFENSGASFEKAIERFNEFYKAHPDKAQAAYYRALAAFRGAVRSHSEFDNAEAEGLLREAIARKSDFPEAYFLLGELYSRQQKWIEAVAAYEMAVKLDPENVSAHYRLGLALQRAGQPARAAQELKTYEQLKEKQNQTASEWLARNSGFIVER